MGLEIVWDQMIQQAWFALENGREVEESWKLSFHNTPGHFPVASEVNQRKLHSNPFPLWLYFPHERDLFTFNMMLCNSALPEFFLPYMVFGVCVGISRNPCFLSFSSSWIIPLCVYVNIFEKRMILLLVKRVTSWGHIELL